MERPKRVAVIGLDAPIVPLMERHMAEGHLPTFKKVFDGGTLAEQCLTPFPTITPPNWTTLATGAQHVTHGVADFAMVPKGKTKHSDNIVDIFDSKYVEAETIWEAMDKQGKKAIVLNWPTAWPSRMKNGIVVAGAGLSPIEMFGKGNSLCDGTVVTTAKLPMATQGTFQPAEGWANLDAPGDKPLEMAVALPFKDSDDKPAPVTWYVLARNLGGAGYDTVSLAPAKDVAKAYCTLKAGEWSLKSWETFKMQDGRERKAFFRVKLLALSPDAKEMRLFITPLADQTPLVSSPDVMAKLDSPQGVPVLGGLLEHLVGLFGLDTYVENLSMYTEYIADMAVGLLKDGDWDGFFMHAHPPDITYHVLSQLIDPMFNKDEASRQEAWAQHLKMYQDLDKMLARILEVCPKDTLIVLVSDHGAKPDGLVFDPHTPLAAAGLTALPDGPLDLTKFGVLGPYAHLMRLMVGGGRIPDKVDITKTQALSSGSCHIWINLKGRDPEGIVDPADYEKVQLRIIDALLTYVDPRNGKRPVALALTREDARLLGQGGENCGDVVYAVYPEWGIEHGNVLPTATLSTGDLRGLWAFYGPGIRKGQRLQRTVYLEDIVPTICYLTGLPLPKDVDGAVVNQVFKDPDFLRKDTAKMRDGLSRMEAAMARKTRQPWDKHDCA